MVDNDKEKVHFFRDKLKNILKTKKTMDELETDDDAKIDIMEFDDEFQRKSWANSSHNMNSMIAISFEDEARKKTKLEYKRLMKRGIIKYDHPFRQKWDILIVIVSLYNCVELPLDIAFSWKKGNH